MALLLLSAKGVKTAFTSALALEQAPRCNTEEHIHTESCYMEDILLCEKKMHTHTENCYLVLLEDNDINALLTQIEKTEEKSLEYLIGKTVLQATVLKQYAVTDSEGNPIVSAPPTAAPSAWPSESPMISPSVTPSIIPSVIPSLSPSASPTPTPSVIPSLVPNVSAGFYEPVPVTNEDIALLNAVTAANGTQDSVVLNENLAINIAADDGMTESELLASLLNGSNPVSTLSAGDPVSDDNNTANFYVYLLNTEGVGEWVHIGTQTFSVSGYYYNYSANISRNNIVNLLNGALGTSYTRNQFRIAVSSDPGSASGSSVSLNNSTVRLGSYSSQSEAAKAKYVRITSTGGSWSSPGLTFCRITYIDSEGNQTVSYVQSGRNYTVENAGDERVWNCSNGNKYSGGEVITALDRSLIFTERRSSYTISYENLAGEQILSEDEVVPGDEGYVLVPAQAMPAGYEDHVWILEGGDGSVIPVGESVKIYGDVTFVAIPGYYTVTYYDSAGTQTGKVTQLPYNSQYTLEPIPEGCTLWLDLDTMTEAGTTVLMNKNYRFKAMPMFTVTYRGSDGSTLGTEQAMLGEYTVKADLLPDGYIWKDDSGNRYEGGETITLDRNVTFTVNEQLTVTYAVNFPNPLNAVYSNTVTQPTAPTIAGMAASTATETVTSGDAITAKNVSQTIILASTNHGQNAKYPVFFNGWTTETGELIVANSKLSWEELKLYDGDDDGNVELNGNWSHGRSNTVNFYILKNSQTDQMSSSSPSDYTPVMYSTYMGGNIDTGFEVWSDDDKEALINDKDIRKMVGASSGSMWLATFPTDQEVFEYLKNYTNNNTLMVEGETVRTADLNENEYAIRWFKVIGYHGSDGDGWHVDGKLVKKEGVVHVTKTFSGNSTLVSRAKEGFYIVAENDGGTKFYILTLEAVSNKASHPAYRTGAVFLTPIDDGDGDSNTYLWEVEDVDYNELWHIEEHPPDVSGAADYSEWVIVDASANSQSSAGGGTLVSVNGVTHATDLENPEWLRAEFNNIYYRGNSLMIKKEDAKTGHALAGASFRLYQNGILMTFDYNGDTGLYEFSSNGTGTVSTLVSAGGYVNISTTGFAYDRGDISIVEITAPGGYNLVGEVTIGYTEDTNGDGVYDSTPGITNPAQAALYAEYHDGLLIVENSSDPISVKVEKNWLCDSSYWEDITVQLLANGQANLAATLLAGSGQDATVVLNEANGYQLTWTDLPVYANGTAVSWSVQEIKIGSESCKVDGSFANWIVSYDLPEAGADAEGNELVLLRVHNTPHRPLLQLTKTDMSGSSQLSGATFTLVQVDAYGNEIGVMLTETTDSNGLLIFDNLLYGARYKLVEVEAPSGYWKYNQPAYLTISEGGVVSVETHGYVAPASTAYNITVTNQGAAMLPETGGGGTIGYYTVGIMLMLIALGVAILPKLRKEGRYPIRDRS